MSTFFIRPTWFMRFSLWVKLRLARWKFKLLLREIHDVTNDIEDAHLECDWKTIILLTHTRTRLIEESRHLARRIEILKRTT